MRARGWAGWGRRGAAVGAGAGLWLALVLGTAPMAGAHPSGPGGDPSVLHICVTKQGRERIVGEGVACGHGEMALHRKGAGRFIDTGRTVFDTATGFEWEKKTTAVGSGANGADLHDVDNLYDWFDATGSWIAAVNAEAFTGHTDWRVPTKGELLGIVDTTVVGCSGCAPCIDPIFGPTAASGYWSSTELRAPFAGLVDFFGGFAVPFDKHADFHVRAVRGGP